MPREGRGRTGLPPWRTVALLALGAAVGAFGTLTWRGGPTMRVVDAVAAEVDPLGDAVLLGAPPDLEGTALGVVGTLWREEGGEWRRGRSTEGWPTCLEPGGTDLQVTLGLVDVPGGTGRPDTRTVAWLECREGDVEG